MYCLPIYINDSFNVCRLNPIQSEDKDYIPCFVIERNSRSQSQVRLLNILPESGVFDPSKGMSSDFAVRIESIKFQKSENNIDKAINIELQRIGERQGTDTGYLAPSLDPGIFYDNNFDICIDYHQIWTDNPEIASLFVELHLGNCLAKFRLNIALLPNIYDIVVDYGSEASQIWVASRNPNLVASNVNLRANLFEAMKNEFVEKEINKLKETLGEKNVHTSPSSSSYDFYQYDPSDFRLFRSRFFIKSRNKNYINEDSILLLNVKHDLLSVLDDKMYKELPNLKLSDHPDFRMPDVLINGKVIQNVYDEIPKLRNILLTSLIRAVLSKHGSLQNSDEKRACKVTILTPNTYSQEVLSQVRNDLVKAFNTLNYENINKRLVPGIEVATFSESDASFFGWYDPKHFKSSDNGKKILIIDIGKGTTDFSVLELRLNPKTAMIEADRKARSGIIGAGNLMTFALFVSVLMQIIKQKGWDKIADLQPSIMIKNKLNDFINNGDRSKRNRLLRMLDELKCMPKAPGMKSFTEGISKSDNFKNLDKFDELEITGLISIVEGLVNERAYYVPDDDEIISRYADMIAQNLEIELENVYNEEIPVDRLLLMVRGANNNAVVNAIINRLNKKNNSIKRIKVDKQILKSACLFGPLNKSVDSSFDSDILSWPLPRKDEFHVTKDQQVRKQQFEEAKKNISALFNLSTRSGIASEAASAEVTMAEPSVSESNGETNIIAKLFDWIYTKTTQNGNSGTNSQDKPQKSVKKSKSNVPSSKRLFYGGNQDVIEVNMGYKKDHTHYLQIGNRQYSCAEMNDIKSHIFFDGEQFLLRNDEKSAKLVAHFQRTNGSTLIYESMYPDVTLVSDSDTDFSVAFTSRLDFAVQTNISNIKSDNDGNDF
jgi:hypothetical protein